MDKEEAEKLLAEEEDELNARKIFHLFYEFIQSLDREVQYSHLVSAMMAITARVYQASETSPSQYEEEMHKSVQFYKNKMENEKFTWKLNVPDVDKS